MASGDLTKCAWYTPQWMHTERGCSVGATQLMVGWAHILLIHTEGWCSVGWDTANWTCGLDCIHPTHAQGCDYPDPYHKYHQTHTQTHNGCDYPGDRMAVTSTTMLCATVTVPTQRPVVSSQLLPINRPTLQDSLRNAVPVSILPS